MIFVDVIVGILAAAALLYWLASALTNIAVFVIRCAGYSSTSGLPGVPALTGLVVFVCLYGYFKVIKSPLWWLVLIAPDAFLRVGELIFRIRVRVLQLPDKASQ